MAGGGGVGGKEDGGTEPLLLTVLALPATALPAVVSALRPSRGRRAATSPATSRRPGGHSGSPSSSRCRRLGTRQTKRRGEGSPVPSACRWFPLSIQARPISRPRG
ncbi:hypothetical protein ZWY2020_054849 [Hordeum vulgare]|nr:hypothetical protein ZWY2020_054849 [Hordeum vulgare]